MSESGEADAITSILGTGWSFPPSSPPAPAAC